MQGKIFEEVHHVQTDDTKMAVRHTFLPISNKEDKLMRVLMLAFPEKN
jgi:hypothetical protein